MSKKIKRYKRSKTKRRQAEMKINLGEKFFYAAYITPIIVLTKNGFQSESTSAAILLLGFFTLMGIFSINQGLTQYDRLKD